MANLQAELAWAIIKFTNPCILSILMLMVIAFKGASNMSKLLGSLQTLILFLIALPSLYIYVRIRVSKIDARYIFNPTGFLRHHPVDVLVLEVLCGLPCLMILSVIKAPQPLISTLVALMVSSFLVALLNLFYRVSYHLTGVIILSIIAIETWGTVLLFLLPIILLVGWAKYRVQEHTLVQMAIAATVSLAATSATLYLLA